VICGFGRLGRNFGCEALGFRPQALSIAKALASAYLPIAGVMMPEMMYQALLTEAASSAASITASPIRATRWRRPSR